MIKINYRTRLKILTNPSKFVTYKNDLAIPSHMIIFRYNYFCCLNIGDHYMANAFKHGSEVILP